MLKESKILKSAEVSEMLPNGIQCEIVDEKFMLGGTTLLPNWVVFQLLPEGTRIQLINNKFVMSPSPTFDHQNIAGQLYKLISNHVEAHDLGVVAIAPLDVHFNDDEIYQPDIFFISNENKFIIQKGAIYGAPDFIVEILSPSNAHYDLVDKKKIYEQRGVKEYWVVNPETKEATGFFLQNEKYELIGSATGVINSLLFNTTFPIR